MLLGGRRRPFWHTAYPSTDGFSLNDASCATPTLCIAVGGSGEAVVQDGDHQYETRPEPVPTFNAVSRARHALLPGRGQPGERRALAGRQFGAVDSIDDDFELQSVSCPTRAFWVEARVGMRVDAVQRIEPGA